jgi:hypothetical protein
LSVKTAQIYLQYPAGYAYKFSSKSESIHHIFWDPPPVPPLGNFAAIQNLGLKMRAAQASCSHEAPARPPRPALPPAALPARRNCNSVGPRWQDRRAPPLAGQTRARAGVQAGAGEGRCSRLATKLRLLSPAREGAKARPRPGVTTDARPKRLAGVPREFGGVGRRRRIPSEGSHRAARLAGADALYQARGLGARVCDAWLAWPTRMAQRLGPIPRAPPQGRGRGRERPIPPILHPAHQRAGVCGGVMPRLAEVEGPFPKGAGESGQFLPTSLPRAECDLQWVPSPPWPPSQPQAKRGGGGGGGSSCRAARPRPLHGRTTGGSPSDPPKQCQHCPSPRPKSPDCVQSPDCATPPA